MSAAVAPAPALTAPAPKPEAAPDYLPARMVNEFVYCPRLFYYEWVEGIFRSSAETEEGKAQHRRADQGPGALPAAETLGENKIHSRSVTLSSDRYRVIAKLDVIEAEDGWVVPVDYKHGRPRETDAGLELWPADLAQLTVQAMVLRDNGYQCREGVAYYWKTRQRVRVEFTDELMAQILAQIEAAWTTAAGPIPAPLEDSPKCPGCSLAPICLPDETNALLRRAAQDDAGQYLLFESLPAKIPPAAAVRPLITPRDDLKPAYLNTAGLRVGLAGGVLTVKDKEGKKAQDIRLGELNQLNLMGNIQITTQAVQALCEAEVPICYFSGGGWFYGMALGMNTKNVFLRRAQYRLAEEAWFCLRLSRRLVAGKIRNQRTMLLRNHVEPPELALEELRRMAARAEEAASLETLLGIEGNAARIYFSAFAGMLKQTENAEETAQCNFDFEGRNRRPPRDPVNALLSLAYSMLAKDWTIACYAVGFDPMLGFYHQPRFGRPALALDMMEPFRALIADSAVLSAINTRMVTPEAFVRAGQSVALTAEGRKAFYRAYELRMDSLVTHPLFEYRVSYRRLLEIQARLLARYLQGEIGEYPVFVTR